eukprot:UN30004
MPGSHVCACNHGYEGDGVTCEEIDPCAICDGINSECTVIDDQPVCSCPDGWIGDPFVECTAPDNDSDGFTSEEDCN